MSTRQWVTTQDGHRVDVARAVMMKLEGWDGRKFQMQDRWILTIGWGHDAQRLVTFANREDGQHAFDALTRHGWALLNPDGWVPHTLAMNLARLRGAEARSYDQELTWTVLLEADNGWSAQAGILPTHAAALQHLESITDQADAEPPSSARVDLADPLWRTVNGSEDLSGMEASGENLSGEGRWGEQR